LPKAFSIRLGRRLFS